MSARPGGLDSEFDHSDNNVRNLTFRNVSMINNTNCGISVSPSALVFNPASGRYDAPNSVDITFEDILVDNRGQGRMSGDDMAGVQITGTPPALRGAQSALLSQVGDLTFVVMPVALATLATASGSYNAAFVTAAATILGANAGFALLARPPPRSAR